MAIHVCPEQCHDEIAVNSSSDIIIMVCHVDNLCAKWSLDICWSNRIYLKISLNWWLPRIKACFVLLILCCLIGSELVIFFGLSFYQKRRLAFTITTVMLTYKNRMLVWKVLRSANSNSLSNQNVSSMLCVQAPKIIYFVHFYTLST